MAKNQPVQTLYYVVAVDGEFVAGGTHGQSIKFDADAAIMVANAAEKRLGKPFKIVPYKFVPLETLGVR